MTEYRKVSSILALRLSSESLVLEFPLVWQDWQIGNWKPDADPSLTFSPALTDEDTEIQSIQAFWNFFGWSWKLSSIRGV